MELIIKLISPWHRGAFVYSDVRFDTGIPIEHADGVLWEHSIDERILEYKGIKGWYATEPSWHSMYRQGLYRRAKKVLKAHEFFHFAHTDLRYRVPHITHYNHIDNFLESGGRRHECVAIVSNAGGRFWFCRPGLRLRNTFITNERVQLFGRRAGWESFYGFGLTWRSGFPKSYKGELGWIKWGSEEQIEFLSGFKVNVCMENAIEPHYFSEKLYNAVRAGCIPIYHGHPTLRTGILRGLIYVDPEDYKFEPNATFDAALSMNIQEVQAINRVWLQKDDVRKTNFDSVWSRLAAILRHQKLYSDSHFEQ
jgi:hypothetical protein